MGPKQKKPNRNPNQLFCLAATSSPPLDQDLIQRSRFTRGTPSSLHALPRGSIRAVLLGDADPTVDGRPRKTVLTSASAALLSTNGAGCQKHKKQKKH
ncbi:hypothetical protein GQ457_16G015440 [Hibiscus cannabinus]